MSEVQGRDRANFRDTVRLEQTHRLTSTVVATPGVSDTAFAVLRITVHDGNDAMALKMLSKVMVSGTP